MDRRKKNSAILALAESFAQTLHNLKQDFTSNGFLIINDIYSEPEIERILYSISQADNSSETFRKTEDLFAIRQFLREVPTTLDAIFTEKLMEIVELIFGDQYFITKSIYFDKPEKSNWFVAYHQDLTISVDKKLQLPGFGPWTTKHNQFAVQPPLNILEQSFTIRIHLDNTTAENGALKIIPGSHRKGVYRPDCIDWNVETEQVCEVRRGGIMIMSPLLLHSSGRTTNRNRRRVIHIEFSKASLPAELQWAEYLPIQAYP